MLSGSTDALLCKKLFGTQKHSYIAIIGDLLRIQTHSDTAETGEAQVQNAVLGAAVRVL